MKQFDEDIKTYNFTNDQANAVSNILDFIAAPFDEKKFTIGISGAGGTGKTYITNYIVRNCKYALSTIQCCSPTHKACRVFSQAMNGIPVDTIQSTFGFRLTLNLEDFDPNNPQFNPMAKPKLDMVKILIVDECSMLPAKIVNYINKVCKEASIKVIYLGDLSQLPPVKESKSIAFDKCYKVFTLNQIVRQEENNPIRNLLNLLREDINNKTYKFLEFISKNIGNQELTSDNKGWMIVRENKFRDYIDTHFNDEDYTKNIDLYRIVAYTNKKVADWNHYVRNQIIKDADKKIITKNDLLMSYETIVDDFLSIIINNSEEYIIYDMVDYVDSKYKFKGFLIKFQLVNGGHITKPLFIIDHRDNFTIQLYVKTLNELIRAAKNATGATRTARWKEYFNFKKTYLIAANILDKYGNIIVNRDIDYGFAITAHRSQGSTYDTVFVDINDMVYDKNNSIYTNQNDLLRRLYVACSRAKNKLILCYGKD